TCPLTPGIWNLASAVPKQLMQYHSEAVIRATLNKSALKRNEPCTLLRESSGSREANPFRCSEPGTRLGGIQVPFCFARSRDFARFIGWKETKRQRLGHCGRAGEWPFDCYLTESSLGKSQKH